MPGEISLFGVLVPGLLLVFVLSLLLQWGVDWVIGRFGLYRYVWHPSLFRIALFACIFGGIGLLSMR